MRRCLGGAWEGLGCLGDDGQSGFPDIVSFISFTDFLKCCLYEKFSAEDELKRAEAGDGDC